MIFFLTHIQIPKTHAYRPHKKKTNVFDIGTPNGIPPTNFTVDTYAWKKKAYSNLLVFSKLESGLSGPVEWWL